MMLSDANGFFQLALLLLSLFCWLLCRFVGLCMLFFESALHVILRSTYLHLAVLLC